MRYNNFSKVSVVVCFLITTRTLAQILTLPPVTQVIEFTDSTTRSDSKNNDITSDTSVKILNVRPNSEIVVDTSLGSAKTARLLLKCSGQYPIQWVYEGTGRPELSTVTNVEWPNVKSGRDSQKPLRFTAEATIYLLSHEKQTLKSEDSGNYTCRSIQNPQLATYYYIYVPGSSLFVSGGRAVDNVVGSSVITFSQHDASAKIPCTVSNPNVVVTLHKSMNGRLGCSKDFVSSFDPARGFILDLIKEANPAGIYLCIANYQDKYEIVKFKVTSRTTAIRDACHPNPCGKKAECQIRNESPVCFCFRGHTGNPYSQCTQEITSRQNHTQTVFSNQRLCVSDNDCRFNLAVQESCVNNECVNLCHPSRCDKGSHCQVINRRAFCRRLSHFRCKNDADCNIEEVCNYNNKDFTLGTCVLQQSCHFNACGVNALCQQDFTTKETRCECPTGFTGSPLVQCFPISSTTTKTTKRPSFRPTTLKTTKRPTNFNKCQSHNDCSLDKFCIRNQCTDPCKGQCGPSSRCLPQNFNSRKRQRRQLIFTGDDRPVDYTCISESLGGIQLTTSRPFNILSPCHPSLSPCGSLAQCTVEAGEAICTCVTPFEIGNPYEECRSSTLLRPIVPSTQGTTTRRPTTRTTTSRLPSTRITTTATTTRPKQMPGLRHECDPTFPEQFCGLNGACTLINSRWKCSCKADYSGRPPNCDKNCRTSNSCDDDESCISGTCQNPCQPYISPCASTNSECRVVRHQPICFCKTFSTENPFDQCYTPQNQTQDINFVTFPDGRTTKGTRRPITMTTTTARVNNPCSNPEKTCGKNSVCFIDGNRAICKCKKEFIGAPPNCRQECQDDVHCFSDRICKNNKCVNSCEENGVCAENADCLVDNHVALCTCQNGFSGVGWLKCESLDEVQVTGDEYLQFQSQEPRRPGSRRLKYRQRINQNT